MQPTRHLRRTVSILSLIYLAEVTAGLTLVSLYKLAAPIQQIFHSKWGVLAVGCGGIALIVLALIVRQALSAPRSTAIALMLNITAIASITVLAEVILRSTATHETAGIRTVNALLVPSWPEIVRKNRQIISEATPSGSWSESYVVYDRDLGWSIGPNRRSEDGLYFSSHEGIRSNDPDVRYETMNASATVALVGDSNAFSLEVPYADTWGHHLQQSLPEGTIVLNYGVNGYGIDQAFLRYERDVRPANPDVVVFAFIQHDLFRSFAAYTFLSFPPWELRFAKPRFAIIDDRLVLMNRPTPTPEAILATESAHDLPNVDLDIGYDQYRWQSRFSRWPYVIRLFTSLFPAWRKPSDDFSDEAIIDLNSRILRKFHERASSTSSIPLLLLLPSGAESNDLATAVLRRAGLPYLDLTACLAALPQHQRRVESDAHFSGVANRLLAECAAPRITSLLQKRQSREAAESR
jgi:hypothetical protein